MSLQRCYRFRLEPTPVQEQAFRQFAGCRRFVWNWGLAQQQAAYRATGGNLPALALMGALTQLKRQPDTAFLKACNAQALQQTLRDLDRAFTNFFAGRARFPRPKSRKRTPHAFRIPQGVRVDGDRVHVPSIGLVRARLHRMMEGAIKSATIKQDAAGHWPRASAMRRKAASPAC